MKNNQFGNCLSFRQWRALCGGWGGLREDQKGKRINVIIFKILWGEIEKYNFWCDFMDGLFDWISIQCYRSWKNEGVF